MPSLIKKLSARVPSLPRIPEPESGEEEISPPHGGARPVNRNAWGESTTLVNGNGGGISYSRTNGINHYENVNSSRNLVDRQSSNQRENSTSSHLNGFSENTASPEKKDSRTQRFSPAPGWSVFGGRRTQRQTPPPPVAPKTPPPPVAPKTPPAPRSPVDAEVSRITHGKSAASKVRYNRTPVRMTVAGDWALKECEVRIFHLIFCGIE